MTPWEHALLLVDEAADALSFGELDEWTPFDPVDDLTLVEADRLLVEANKLKRAAEAVEKQIKHRIEGLLVDSGETVTRRSKVDGEWKDVAFPCVRFGHTVYTYRVAPTDPKPGRWFFDWAGGDVARLGRIELRKTDLFAVADERGEPVDALIDSEIIDWPEPAGAPKLGVIDLHSQFAPKWAESVPDKWEETT